MIPSALSQLGFTADPATAESSQQLERLLDEAPWISAEYVAFLREVGGGYGSFGREIVFAGVEPSCWAGDGLDALQFLFSSADEVRRKTGGYAPEEMSDGWLVIGECNLFAVPLVLDGTGRVLVWNRTGGLDEPTTYVAGHSFNDFLNRLREAPTESRDDGPKVISFETSPELDAAAREWLAKRKK